MAGPLEGIRILDLSAVMSGPLATTVLADQGADVIKIEAPNVGDVLRWLGSRRGGLSGLFHATNRGKRSIVINLRDERGQKLVRTLARSADVVVQNFRPGVIERLGLGYDALCKERADLIYVSITGFGSEGPYAQQPVYDNVIQAYSGMACVQGHEDEPALTRHLVCDKITAWMASQAITAALLARERGHGGQKIDLSMLDAVIAFLWVDAASDRMLLGNNVSPQPTIGSRYLLTRFADGFGTVAPLSDAQFHGLCRAFEHPELCEDPRFATLTDRFTNVEETAALFRGPLAEAAARLTRAEAAQRLTEEGVPFGMALNLDEVPFDPQVQANETFLEREHPVAGKLREARPAAHFRGTPTPTSEPAPGLGQHTNEILQEYELGEQLALLRDEGVVA